MSMRDVISLGALFVFVVLCSSQADDADVMSTLRTVWPELSWPATSVCNDDWPGVDVTPGCLVTGISLSSRGLTGEIPTQLGNLTQLDALDLSNNSLTGLIPAQLGELTKLITLDLSNNQLNGSIPTELQALTTLETLYLQTNNLSGFIPTQLGNLTSLKNLNLAVNWLSGPIPTHLGQLTQLTLISLRTNELSGTIPTELGELTSLERLVLFSNQLSGAIPTQLGNLSELNYLHLAANSLSGPIPTQLGNSINLTHLYLHDNNLSGAIPPEFIGLVHLTDCSLNDNPSLSCKFDTLPPPCVESLPNCSCMNSDCPCPAPVPSAICSGGTWQVPEISSNATIPITAPIIVSGNATFGSGSVVIFASGNVSIDVANTAFLSLNSTFVLCLTEDQLPKDASTTITLISGGSGGLIVMDGSGNPASGSPVVLVSADGDCFASAEVSVSPRPIDCSVSSSATSSKFAVLISDCKSDGISSKSNTRTLAIAVGVVVGVAVIVAIVVGVIIWRIRTGRSHCGSRLVWSTERSRELM